MGFYIVGVFYFYLFFFFFFFFLVWGGGSWFFCCCCCCFLRVCCCFFNYLRQEISFLSYYSISKHILFLNFFAFDSNFFFFINISSFLCNCVGGGKRRWESFWLCFYAVDYGNFRSFLNTPGFLDST